jgi:hypothetical protein
MGRNGLEFIAGLATRITLRRRNEAPPADHDGNAQRARRDTSGRAGHRGRDAAALAGLVVVLAALWAATFFSSARVWGEYRPEVAELQDPPPPPTILVPALTLDEARKMIERAADGGVGSHDPR